MSESFPGGGLEPGRNFRTTHWSVVMAARHAPTAESVAALEVLAKTYWMPLYTFIRRRGTDPTEAQDLTQGFFARLLEKEWLLTADAERGRFRTFLLTALTRFLSDEYDRATALKRGGGTTAVSLDFGLAEERLALEPADGRTPEQAFDRAWAEALLEKVLSRLAAVFWGRGANLLGFVGIEETAAFVDEGPTPLLTFAFSEMMCSRSWAMSSLRPSGAGRMPCQTCLPILSIGVRRDW